MLHTKQTIEATCDGCGKKEELNAAAFSIAETILNKRGWSVVEDWLGNKHYCPECTKNKRDGQH